MEYSQVFQAFSSLESGPAVLAAGAVVLAYYLISTVVSWYKLRHIRGPFLASITNLWLSRLVWTGQICDTLGEEQKKYGQVMRVGPNAISVYDPETLIHMHKARSTYPKAPWYDGIRMDWRGHSVLSEPDTILHDKRKAKLAKGFAVGGPKNLEKKIDSWIGALVVRIREKITNGEAVMDIGLLVQYFQVDLITEAGLGKAWGDLADDRDHYEYLAMNNTVLPFIHSFCYIPLLRGLLTSTWLMKLVGPKTTDKNGLGLFLGLLEKETESRFDGRTQKLKEGGTDMLSEWLRHGLSAQEAQLDLALQVPAGTETSATAIRGLLLAIMSSPTTYIRLKQEIKDAIEAGRISDPITNDEAKGLVYLQAAIKETLRVMSPVVAGFPKQVPESGDTIGGVFVPGGTEVHANFHLLMRNPEIFGEDVDIFRPERFLGSDPAIPQMVKTVDLIFGTGRFMCLGKGFALMELNKIFVQLLRNFDFQMADPERPWKRTRRLTVYINDFWVKVSEAGLE
ncbi:cytochrome P450 [Xylariaceae sp. FL0255]|nr:cytochrome P450 [Xylariaceae sp. FL0255]